MPSIYKEQRNINGKIYKYTSLFLRLNAEQADVKKAIAEMEKLGINAPTYFRKLLREKFKK